MAAELPAERRPRPPWTKRASWTEMKPGLAEHLVEAMEADRFPAYLHGPVGTGKTCAAVCVYTAWPTEPAPLFIDVGMFLNAAMRERMGGQSLRSRKAWGVWFEVANTVVTPDPQVDEQTVLWRSGHRASLVVLDDIGVRTPSEAKLGLLFELINAREGRPLIATSNLDPRELERTFDSRIASRLCAELVIRVTGPDRRTQGTKVVEV